MRRLDSILFLAIVVAGCGAPTPSPAASAMRLDPSPPVPSVAAGVPSAGPSFAAPTALSSPQAGFEPSPGTPARTPIMGPRPPFYPEAIVVTVSDDLRVRSKPRVSADSVKYQPLLAIGTVLEVLAGPVAASGYWWYRMRLVDAPLRGGITTGWVAAADHDGELWIDWYGGDTEPVPEPEYPALPDPVLVAAGTEDYDDAFGNPYTRYDLTVANWADYPAEIFESDAALEPCGPNAPGTRTWVDIVDADLEERIYGFCGLTEPQDLTGLWFAVPRGTAPPSQVYVTLWDRLYDRFVASNAVSPHWPFAS